MPIWCTNQNHMVRESFINFYWFITLYELLLYASLYLYIYLYLKRQLLYITIATEINWESDSMNKIKSECLQQSHWSRSHGYIFLIVIGVYLFRIVYRHEPIRYLSGVYERCFGTLSCRSLFLSSDDLAFQRTTMIFQRYMLIYELKILLRNSNSLFYTLASALKNRPPE